MTKSECRDRRVHAESFRLSGFGFLWSFVIRHSTTCASQVHGFNAMRKTKGRLHEPPRASNCSLPWESGAEDARTPNAAASSVDSAGSAKRLECVRFIGAFRPAW